MRHGAYGQPGNGPRGAFPDAICLPTAPGRENRKAAISITLMKSALIYTLAAACLLLAACSKAPADKAKAGQPQEVPKLVAAEAANLASDASFAIQIRDYARAEKSLARAVELRPDIPDWWLSLGSACKRQSKIGDARSAYKKALALYEKRYAATADVADVQQQLIMLVLLGREDEARKLLERSRQKQPDQPVLKRMSEGKIVDQLLGDPNIQQLKL
jgi:tetratricopeptide (TPR) repeat protein